MSETAYVSMFIVLRILLVGGIFLAIPLITRKGLLFGAYVGEEVADHDAARGMVRRWYRDCLLMMALALLAGLSISLAGAPLAGNYISAAILLLGYGVSAEAQVAFRATMANLLSGTALFICAILTVFSVQVVRVGLSQTDSVGIGFLVICVAMVLYALFNLFRIMVKYGQGGALIEQGSTAAPLTNGIADNEHWVWGAFYVNRNDPSIMVEKRFGLGYTMNYGNPTAVLIVVTLVVLLVTLTTVGLIEMLS